MDNQQKYWFPAKRYGYGWGLPITWQGWLVFLIYLTGTLFLALCISDPIDLFWFVPLHLLLTGVFVWIVWKKGEPPAWRWGGDNSKTTSDNQS